MPTASNLQCIYLLFLRQFNDKGKQFVGEGSGLDFEFDSRNSCTVRKNYTILPIFSWIQKLVNLLFFSFPFLWDNLLFHGCLLLLINFFDWTQTLSYAFYHSSQFGLPHHKQKKDCTYRLNCFVYIVSMIFGYLDLCSLVTIGPAR